MQVLETLRVMQNMSHNAQTDDCVLSVDCFVNYQRKRLPITDIELYDNEVLMMNKAACA